MKTKINDKFTGIWIPSEALKNNPITLPEKILLSMINTLCKNEKCYASNGYFSEILDLSERQIQRMIKKLKDSGCVKVDLIYDKKEIKVTKRNITFLSWTARRISHGRGDKCGAVIIKTNNKEEKLYAGKMHITKKTDFGEKKNLFISSSNHGEKKYG